MSPPLARGWPGLVLLLAAAALLAWPLADADAKSRTVAAKTRIPGPSPGNTTVATFEATATARSGRMPRKIKPRLKVVNARRLPAGVTVVAGFERRATRRGRKATYRGAIAVINRGNRGAAAAQRDDFGVDVLVGFIANGWTGVANAADEHEDDIYTLYTPPLFVPPPICEDVPPASEADGYYIRRVPTRRHGSNLTARQQFGGSFGWVCPDKGLGSVTEVAQETGGYQTPECMDGRDNDGDAVLDYMYYHDPDRSDPDCEIWTDLSESGSAAPSGDPGQGGTGGSGGGTGGGGTGGGDATTPACSDTQDNDGDGKIDAGADPGCENASDNTETGAKTLTVTVPCPDQVDDPFIVYDFVVHIPSGAQNPSHQFTTPSAKPFCPDSDDNYPGTFRDDGSGPPGPDGTRPVRVEVHVDPGNPGPYEFPPSPDGPEQTVTLVVTYT